MNAVNWFNANKSRLAGCGIPAVAVVLLAAIPAMVESLYSVHILVMVFFYAIAALSLRAIVISGQFPLGHAAFMGIGAYASGMACKWLHLPAELTIPGAALFTMVIGVLVAYSFARLRALYYAMGSLFLGVADATGHPGVHRRTVQTPGR